MRVEEFLPFIENWATCDQFSPIAFKKEPEKLLPYIDAWIKSDRTYTVRFAIGMLMQHFLGERFDLKYAEMVSAVRSEEYYVNMMIAWYFATALAGQYERRCFLILKKKAARFGPITRPSKGSRKLQDNPGAEGVFENVKKKFTVSGTMNAV